MQSVTVLSKIGYLMKIWESQSASSSALIDANMKRITNKPREADECYGRYKKLEEEHLRLAEEHNMHHEQPIDVLPIIRTMLDNMSIWANVVESLSLYDRAKSIRNEMLELSRRYLGENGEAEVKRGLAASLTTAGKFNEAFIALYAARDAYERMGDPVKLARTTLDMVDLLQWLGDQERALTELNRASKIVAEKVKGRKPDTNDILSSLLSLVGNMQSATGIGNEVVQITELYRISTELDYYMGLICKANGNFDEAETAFSKVLPEYRKIGVGPAIEFQYCSIDVSRKRYNEALNRIGKIRDVFESDQRFRPKVAALLKLEAESQLYSGTVSAALSTIKKAIDAVTVHYDPDLLWRIQWLHAKILMKSGKPDAALVAFEKCTEVISSLRNSSLGYRLDSLFLKDKIDVFNEAVTVANSIARADVCARIMDVVKSRALTAVLSVTSKSPAKSGVTNKRQEEAERISVELDALEYRSYKEGSNEALEKKRNGLLIRREALLEEIRISDPRWHSLSISASCDIDKLRSFADRTGRSIISLYLHDSDLTGIFIAPEMIESYTIELDPRVVDAQEEFAENVGLKEPDQTYYDISLKLTIGAKHYIPERLLEKIAVSKGLIIVPHGLLHLLPWAALIWKGKRLFEYVPVGIMPNLSCIPIFQTDTHIQPKIAIFGPPDYSGFKKEGILENADKEAMILFQIYLEHGQTIDKPYIGVEADAKAFNALIDHPDASGGILHVACHAMIEPMEPMNSGLLAADMKIDASEIANRCINYNEVVLSACNTGWRAVKVRDVELYGDDIIGIPGAFMEAGAKSVLVSITKADDKAAAAFMLHYHKARLLSKLNPMQALQQTQIAMLNDGEFNMYQWCGFTIYGCN